MTACQRFSSSVLIPVAYARSFIAASAELILVTNSANPLIAS